MDANAGETTDERHVFDDGERQDDGATMPEFYSQDERTCGSLYVDVACGPVSLANSLKLLGYHVVVEEVCRAVEEPSLNRRIGLHPTALRELACKVGSRFGIEATLVEPCTYQELRPGDLIYLNSVGLKNLQGGYQYVDAEFDSHIVMVERATAEYLKVINPDCRQVGDDFHHDVWGRMHIAASDLDTIWKTSRVDGMTTKKVAVLLRAIIPGETDVLQLKTVEDGATMPEFYSHTVSIPVKNLVTGRGMEGLRDRTLEDEHTHGEHIPEEMSAGASIMPELVDMGLGYHRSMPTRPRRHGRHAYQAIPTFPFGHTH